MRWNIRFPVATGAEAGARAVWDYVNGAKPVINEAARLRRFRIARVAGIVIGLISLPMLVFGLNNRGNTEPGMCWRHLQNYTDTQLTVILRLNAFHTDEVLWRASEAMTSQEI
ncbi:MAG: hypothetical protein ABI852_09180 [Gemmatimonadaceae bacterium]